MRRLRFPHCLSSYIPTMKKHISFFFVLLFAQFSFAVTSAYYNGANGKSGKNLVDQLNAISTTGYEAIEYGTGKCKDCVWGAFGTTDLYPADSIEKAGKIWDMYSNCDFTFQTDQGSSSGTECTGGYNREHSLPKSWFGGGTDKGPGTDLFHIYPTDVHVNGVRNYYPYGEVKDPTTTFNNGGKYGNCSFPSGYTGLAYEPIDQYKGDFARGYMYMLMKWCAQGTSFTQDSGNKGAVTFNDTFTSAGNYGLTAYGVALLMKWHRQDPVSQKEIDRNNAVQKIQGNRNPFIDYPILAEYLWGNKKDQTFYLTDAIGSFDSEFIPGVSDGDGTTACTPVDPTASFTYALINAYVCDPAPSNMFITNSNAEPSYDSSNKSVATVDKSTGEITIVGIGSTTITVTLPATKCFNASSASYELNIEREPADATFTESEIVLDKDETFNNSFTSISDGAVTYESSNDKVVSVDEYGTITALSAGTAQITLTIAQTTCYEAVTASYDVTVYDFKALPATDITDDGFTANWTPANTDSYTLDVFYKVGSSAVENRDTTWHNETFVSGQGSFTIHDVELDGLSSVWSHKTYLESGYMNATGYESGTNHPVESWLLSPEIDLTDATEVTLKFDGAAKFQNGALSEEITLWVAISPSDIFDASEWTQITIPNYPNAGKWTFASTGDIDLAAYKNNKVKLAIRYLSTSSAADTYEMKNFFISGKYDKTISAIIQTSISGYPKTVTNTNAVVSGLDPSSTYFYIVTPDGYAPSNPIEVTTSDPLSKCALTILSSNEKMGIVQFVPALATLTNEVVCGTTVKIQALPKKGYRFVGWSDGVSEPTREVTLTTDSTLTAFFEKNTATALPNTIMDTDRQVRKVLIDGQIYIIREGKTYTIIGQLHQE